MNEKTKTSAIVKVAEQTAIALTPQTVRAYINDKASDQEVALFLNQCAMFGLNPFKREIYLIKYSANDKANFVVGYEVYLKRAERTKNWAGLESGTEDDKDGRLVKAWAKIYRKDWARPLSHEVFLDEYLQTKDEWVGNQKTGKKVPTRFWAEKPKTMLKKVAIEQALRMAFPDEFAGMPYAAEEMPIEHERLPVAEIVIDKAADPVIDAQTKAKAEYESSKKKPLKNVKDEFSDPGEFPGDDIAAQAEHGPEQGQPALRQLEQFAKAKSALAKLGVNEAEMWEWIHKFTAKTYKVAHLDLADFAPDQIDGIVTYLGAWKKNIDEKRAAKSAEEKANDKK